MCRRNKAVAFITSGVVALPAAAIASPVPDPPLRQATDTVHATIDQLTGAYARPTLSQMRSIHNEIVLLINVGGAAL